VAAAEGVRGDALVRAAGAPLADSRAKTIFAKSRAITNFLLTIFRPFG